MAVLLVVVALYVRNRVDEDGGGGGGTVRLLCTTELEAACTELADHADVAVTVEQIGRAHV